jgi:ferritin-like metal-binding protein YciE
VSDVSRCAGRANVNLSIHTNMAALNSLRDLLIDELRDLHNAENQLIKALPKMAKAASHEELKGGLEDHLEQTRDHVDRLERCFKLLGQKARGKTCHAMKGLIEEGKEAIDEEAPDAIRDAKMIGAAQRIEHYEIAGYGTARAFAETLGETKVAQLLQETLDEEGDTNKKLTAMAATINEEANSEGGMDEE